MANMDITVLCSVSSDGKIMIPKVIRDALGLVPGDRLELIIDGARLLLVKEECPQEAP